MKLDIASEMMVTVVATVATVVTGVQTARATAMAALAAVMESGMAVVGQEVAWVASVEGARNHILL